MEQLLIEHPFSTILGAWIAAFLTLGIFSYLYRDNPFYKIAEHVFVGVSAAYWAATFYWTQIYPNLFGRLFAVDSPFANMYVIDKGHEYNGLYFFPLLLGIQASGHQDSLWADPPKLYLGRLPPSI